MTVWQDFKAAIIITIVALLMWTTLSDFTRAAFGMEIKKAELVGMWAYVTTYNEFEDGRKESYFGPNPIGRFAIRASGNYSHIIACSPKDKEDGLCVLNQLNHFGTFTVDEKGGAFTGLPEWASNHVLIGKPQLRVITKLDGKELHYINHASVAGQDAKVHAVLRRVP